MAGVVRDGVLFGPPGSEKAGFPDFWGGGLWRDERTKMRDFGDIALYAETKSPGASP